MNRKKGGTKIKLGVERVREVKNLISYDKTHLNLRKPNKNANNEDG